MMNILIIEDERHSADRLVRILRNLYGDVTVFGPLASVAETRNFFSGNKDIDLILSDIRLTDGLSFDAFDEAPDSVPVIFTTAYDEYAIKAFDYNGIAYILKPVEPEELEKAVEKSRRMLGSKSGGKELSEIYRILTQSPGNFRQRFLVAEKDGYSYVNVVNVACIAADEGLTRLCLTDKRMITVDLSLDEIEAQLDPSDFFRATRRHIVNIRSVRRISNWFNRKIKIIVEEFPNMEIVVGKEKATRLKLWLDR